MAAVGLVELSTTTNESLGRSGLIPGPQATIVPSSVTKVKTELAVVPFAWNVNPEVPVKTTPVGVPAVPFTGDGIFTTSPCFTPCPLSRVETPALLSEIHQGLVGLAISPQGFTSCVSGWPLGGF